MRFGVGARVWLNEIIERDGVDAASALFSESTGRVLVTVPREDDVKFRGLCEGRDYPVMRIGVTDDEGAKLEVQGVFTVSVAELPRALAGHAPVLLRSDRHGGQRMSDNLSEDYGDLGEKRNRRIRIVAWTVIIALILAGGGATVLTLLLG